MTPSESEAAKVESTAREAGALLSSYFQSKALRTSAKAYLDVVTQADTECEKLIVTQLRDAFPEYGFVGEEGTDTGDGAKARWYVDPLDGTYNFSRGLPFWCVSMGLVDESGPAWGIIFDPLRDEMFETRRGEGAFLNGAAIVASSVTDPMQATLQLTVNYDRQRIEGSIRDFNAVARNVMRLRNMGALALELAYVACGRLDAVCQRGSHPWDYAAGVLLRTEAGAVVTDADGSKFRIDTDDALVAATPELHGELLSLLKPLAVRP